MSMPLIWQNSKGSTETKGAKVRIGLVRVVAGTGAHNGKFRDV